MIKKFCVELTRESSSSGVKRYFDLFCISVIVFDLMLFPLETVKFFSIYSKQFLILHHIIIVIFTVEYFIRIIGAENKRGFITSFYGIIDLLAIVPFFLTYGFADTSYFRIFRLVRLFRIFKLTRYSKTVKRLMTAVAEIKVELLTILTISFFVVYIFSALIYVLEHKAQPDKVANMFDAFWLTFVTVTTLGYGDIIPITTGGRALTILFVIFSIGIVIMPSSVLTAHLMEKRKEEIKRNKLVL